MAEEHVRPIPAGLDGWVGDEVTVHLTGAGRVRSVQGRLTAVHGDGLFVAEDDADFWVPREHVQAVSREREDADAAT